MHSPCLASCWNPPKQAINILICSQESPDDFCRATSPPPHWQLHSCLGIYCATMASFEQFQREAMLSRIWQSWFWKNTAPSAPRLGQSYPSSYCPQRTPQTSSTSSWCSVSALGPVADLCQLLPPGQRSMPLSQNYEDEKRK